MARFSYQLPVINRAALFGVVLAFLHSAAAFGQSDGAAPVPTATPAPFRLGPPPGEGDGPTEVRAAFHLQRLNTISDETEMFEFTGLLRLRWRDPRQAFDPVREGVGEKVFQGGYQFDEISPGWYPQVVLTNIFGLYETNAVTLRVLPDGSSTLVSTIDAAARAGLDLRRYPFDAQTLEAEFEIPGFDATEVTLRADPVSAAGDLEGIGVPQWTLTGMDAREVIRPAPLAGNGSGASVFVLAFDVRRQPLFTLRLIVLPLVLIVMLSWSVFWMERSSVGDRMSVSFVGILQAVAYQIVVADLLPEISYLTLIHSFMSTSFVIMCPPVVVNLVVAAYDKKGRYDTGDAIDRRCRVMFPMAYVLLIVFFSAWHFFGP